MSKYYEYEKQLGRPLSERDKRFIDYGLAMGNKITIENGCIRLSTRLTPEQEEIVERARREGTLKSYSISCYDRDFSPIERKEQSSSFEQKVLRLRYDSAPDASGVNPFDKEEKSSDDIQKLSLFSYDSNPFEVTNSVDEDVYPTIISSVRTTTISRRRKTSRVKRFFEKIVSVISGDTKSSDRQYTHSKKR